MTVPNTMTRMHSTPKEVSRKWSCAQLKNKPTNLSLKMEQHQMKKYFLKVIVHVNRVILFCTVKMVILLQSILSLQTAATIMSNTKAEFGPSKLEEID